MRNSAFFSSKKTIKVTCIGCGKEFGAELTEFGRVVALKRNKNTTAKIS